jgi:hypothetical protein
MSLFQAGSVFRLLSICEDLLGEVVLRNNLVRLEIAWISVQDFSSFLYWLEQERRVRRRRVQRRTAELALRFMQFCEPYEVFAEPNT